MQRRYNPTNFFLTSAITMVLTLLMVVVDAQAQIAFQSHRDGNWEIYVMDANRDKQRNLTNNPNDDQSPSWSPDGKRIAFVSNRNGGDWNRQIYVMAADGGNQLNLSNNYFDEWSPSWSPDGKRIAFVSDRSDRHGNYCIYVMDTEGGNPLRLTNIRNDDRSPSWSPDVERIVFVSNRDGNRDINTWLTDEIYVMDADGGNQQGLTENFVQEWSPSWSPDGKRIVFNSNRDGIAEIYVMDADGGNPQNVTNNRHRDFSPAWFDPAFAVEVAPFAVAPADKKLTIWGWLKQADR